MCGRAAINHAAPNIVHACRTSGVTLPPSTPPPSEYATGKTCKHAKDKDGKLGGTTFPVLHSSGGELTVETMEWGIRQLSTHNIWCDDDKWVETKTWRACVGSGRRCAVCVNAFAEGITCRQPSDGLFFLAALYLNGAFVILTTDSTRVPLLAERAASQAEHGVPTRCPLWMDAAEATRWRSRTRSPTLARSLARTLTRNFSLEAGAQPGDSLAYRRGGGDTGRRYRSGAAASMPWPCALGPGPWWHVHCICTAHAYAHAYAHTAHTYRIRAARTLQVRRLEAAVRANKPELVQGSSAAPRARGEALKPDAQQGSLTSFIRKSAGAPSPAPSPVPAPEQAAEQVADPAPALPTPVLTTDSPDDYSAKRAAPRACSACTLETEDAAQAKCEACGCELDPPTSAKRRKPDTAAAPPSPNKRSIQSFFTKKPSPGV